MATIAVAILVVSCALYIMAHRLGLADNLDFGAGAYYYADIPNYERFDNGNAYHSKTPMWVCIVLFLGWGFLMYRLWEWVESRGNKKK